MLPQPAGVPSLRMEALCIAMVFQPLEDSGKKLDEYQPLLYRGGFLLTDLGTVGVIVAVEVGVGVLVGEGVMVGLEVGTMVITAAGSFPVIFRRRRVEFCARSLCTWISSKPGRSMR